MSNDTDEQIVLDAIQTGYGDASQTVLDRQVTRKVLGALRRAGWTSPQELAAVVDAAGGKIIVRAEHIMAALDDQYELLVGDDFDAGPGVNRVVRARRVVTA